EQRLCARVALPIERVAETGEALSGLCLLANAANRIALEEFLELPLGARRRAAVLRTFERGKRSDRAVVQVRVGRDCAAQRERRRVELVVREQHERHADEIRAGRVESPCFAELNVNGKGARLTLADERSQKPRDSRGRPCEPA